MVSLSLLLIVSMVKANSPKISASKTSLLTHFTDDAIQKNQLSQTNVPRFSTIWSSLGYGKTKDTSDQGPGSSRSNDFNVGTDTTYGKMTLGAMLSGIHINARTFLPPPEKSVSNVAAVQPYVSYRFTDYMIFFGSGGVIYTDTRLNDQLTSSSGHLLTLSYIGTIGTILNLPTIKEIILPTLRVSTTRVESTTNSYIWETTYSSRVKSHQQTIDPALRISFLSLGNFTPYIEYGTHWIINRSHSISTEPRRMGQTFIGGTTIFFPADNYRLDFFYQRDNTTTPGHKNYFSLQVSYSF